MNLALVILFLFFVGCLAGWTLEVFYRRFISSSNPERRWVNPGFLTGPYLPLYGFGLALLFLIAIQEPYIPAFTPVGRKILLFALMAVVMTGIEYIAGYFCLKFAHVRLWDYSNQWGNVNGLICPLFSLFWTLLGALYYFLIHPHVIDILIWLSHNLAFSFFIGFFYGVFLIDLANATNVLTQIRRVAVEHKVTVHYEDVRSHIRDYKEETKQRGSFFLSMHSDRPLAEHVHGVLERGAEARSRIVDKANAIAEEMYEMGKK